MNKSDLIGRMVLTGKGKGKIEGLDFTGVGIGPNGEAIKLCRAYVDIDGEKIFINDSMINLVNAIDL